MMSISFSMLMMIPLVFFLLNSFLFFFSSLTFMFMMKISINFMFLNLSYDFGIDLLGFLMVLLSFWTCMLMILASKKLFDYNYNW